MMETRMRKTQKNSKCFIRIIDHSKGNITYHMLLDIFLLCSVAIDNQNMVYQCLQSVQNSERLCNTNLRNKIDGCYISAVSAF